jgi:hypothetical protein
MDMICSADHSSPDTEAAPSPGRAPVPRRPLHVERVGQQVSRVLGSYRSDYINFTLGTVFSVF